MARNAFDVIGLRELQRDLKKLGNMPQTAVNRAAKSSATIAFKDAKRRAPVDIGNLKQGIIIKREKKQRVGKQVYFIGPGRAYNRFFRKLYADGAKEAYYPASQEWGFTVHGHYTPGYRYLKNAIDHNADAMEGEVAKVFRQEIDKALRR